MTRRPIVPPPALPNTPSPPVRHAQPVMLNRKPAVVPPVFRPGKASTLVQMKPAVKATTIQRSWGGGWNKAPSFLNNERQDQATAFPPLGGAPNQGGTPPAIQINVPTALEQWQSKKVTQAIPAVALDPLKGLKEKIQAWDRRSHDGCSWSLSDTQVQEITNFASAMKSSTGKTYAFNVERGAGTGEYEGSDQLKIISIHGALQAGGKKPTYHITIKS